MADKPEYAQIWQALAPHLKHGRRLHIVDGNHFNSVPREIFSSEGLYNLAAQNGKPVYVMEEVGTKEAYELLSKYKKSSPEERNKMRETALASQRYSGSAQSVYDIMERVIEGKAHLVFPDTRDKYFKAQKFSEDEEKILNKTIDVIGLAGEECGLVAYGVIKQSLTPMDNIILDKAVIKFSKAATNRDETSEAIDRDISANVDRLKKRDGIPAKNFEIMIYGALHYLKENDLDEHRKGVTLAVFESPEASKLNREKKYKDGKIIYSDTPDFVWYSNEKRLVKLDTPEAKREFWQGNKPPEPTKNAPDINRNNDKKIDNNHLAACYDKLKDVPLLAETIKSLQADLNRENPNINLPMPPKPDRPGLDRN